LVLTVLSVESLETGNRQWGEKEIMMIIIIIIITPWL
jgi:hypothetical protein